MIRIYFCENVQQGCIMYVRPVLGAVSSWRHGTDVYYARDCVIVFKAFS